MMALGLIVFALLLLGIAAGVWLSFRQREAFPDALRERLRAFDAHKGEAGNTEFAQDDLLDHAARYKKESFLLQAEEWLRQAGLRPKTYLPKAAIVGLLITLLLAFLVSGWLALAFILVFYPLALWGQVRYRIGLRRSAAILALPGFLDAVVRASRVGASLPAALLSATKDAHGPVREVFNQIMRRQQSGTPIDQAMLTVGKRYQMQELAIIATVLRLNMRYGGRTDVVLERIADWLRGRVMAQAEFNALSAETRLGALILSLMIPGLALYIVLMNHSYLQGMWAVSTGRMLLVAGGTLLVTGVVLLNRMAKLR
ncbi:type II secretion system F family protein [Acidithiobacillus sp.]|uniref:type II secretion system F family protein n=1 Tax=Acidithiobacillus sp. TaxID=1872118 RepID=UPI0031FE90F1